MCRAFPPAGAMVLMAAHSREGCFGEESGYLCVIDHED